VACQSNGALAQIAYFCDNQPWKDQAYAQQIVSYVSYKYHA